MSITANNQIALSDHFDSLSLSSRIKLQTTLFKSIFPHIDNASDTISGLHVLKSLRDVLQRLAMRNELVDLEFALHVIVYQCRQLGPALDTAESTSFPYTTRDKLECYHTFVSLKT